MNILNLYFPQLTVIRILFLCSHVISSLLAFRVLSGSEFFKGPSNLELLRVETVFYIEENVCSHTDGSRSKSPKDMHT